MSEKTIKLSAATQAQLREFAEAYLGMTFPDDEKTEAIRAKIAAAWSKPEIPIGDEPEPAPKAEAKPKAAAKAEGKPKKVRLIVHGSDDEDGNEPIQLGVNGKVMLVPRGEEVEIPYAYFEVLKNAVTHRYEPLRDGGINPVPRKVQLYPFQVIA